MYYVSRFFRLVGFTWKQGFPIFWESTVVVTLIVVHIFLMAALTLIDTHLFQTKMFSILEIMVAVSKPISHTIVVIICFFIKEIYVA
jgi:hypothetical protein